MTTAATSAASSLRPIQQVNCFWLEYFCSFSSRKMTKIACSMLMIRCGKATTSIYAKTKKKTQSQKFHRSNLRCCLYRDKYCFAICCFRFHSIIFGHYFPFSHSILVISLVYCCCSMEKCDFTHSECVSILLWKISNEARE